MSKQVCEKLEIPLGGERRLYIYVQAYGGKKCSINVYYYDKKPYDSGVDSDTEVFGFCISFRI